MYEGKVQVADFAEAGDALGVGVYDGTFQFDICTCVTISSAGALHVEHDVKMSDGRTT